MRPVSMTVWQRWLTKPQSVFLRKALFQIHLWTGLALGVYVVVLCLSGSALVFRDELDELFETPRPEYDASARVLSTAELRTMAEQAYPGYTITRVGDRVRRQNPVIEIWMDRAGDHKERLFNPYTGEDLGEAVPRGTRAILWLARLHDELLFGDNGKFWNGVGSALMTVLVVTGAVIWWPGIRSWRRGMTVKWRAAWPRLNFDLHSAMGFWFFAIIAIWAVSGIYLAIPEPFAAFVDRISDPEAILGQRPGDVVLRWLVRIHFGRWESHTLKAVWVALGLVPVLMFLTGVTMWWQRVIRKRSLT